MGEYSLEPPRRDLLLHLGFDHIEGDRVLDRSPQGNDAELLNGPTTATGRVGQALDVTAEEDEGAVVSRSSTVGKSAGALTLSAWVNPADYQPTADQYVFEQGGVVHLRLSSSSDLQFYLDDDGGTTHSLSASGVISGFTHVAATVDRDGMALYVDGALVAENDDTFSLASTSSDLYVGRNASASANLNGLLDDARVYRRSLDANAVSDLYNMGVDHAQRRRLKDAWDNDGIPFQGTNVELAGALSEQQSAYFRDLDAVREARHIQDAAGEQLDRIGFGYGVPRESGESDARYRARIIGELAAGRSDGTFGDVLEAAATIIGTRGDRIFIDTQYDSDPGRVFIQVRTTDIENSNLTTGDLSSLFDKTVPAGHRAVVVETGQNPFTLTDDATANDPTLGLTSDSTSDGGGLVSDA